MLMPFPYFIKPDYIHRSVYHHHDDRPWTDGGQDEVYAYARKLRDGLIVEDGPPLVIDIGCGSGLPA